MRLTSLDDHHLVNFVLCLWILSITYSSTAYVSSIGALEAQFQVSQTVGILGVSLLILGLGFGPLVFAPVSELLGRRVIYIITGIGYTAFSFGVAWAPNVSSLLISRFLVGFFGSSPMNTVPASIGDFTTAAERGPYTILYAVMAFGGPALGPLCSSFIERDAGSDWNLRVIAIFSGVMSLAAAFVPETYGPTLLKWKLKREGQVPPALSTSQVVAVYRVALARPFVYLFTEPIVAVVSLYLSFLYGLLYGFYQSFSVIYIEIRGMSRTSYGLTYIALGLGFFVASFLLATVANASYAKAAAQASARGERTPPEARLTLAYPGALLAPISLFLFAWSAPYTSAVHWAVPCFAELLFGCSTMLLFTACTPYLIENYLQTAASALAAGMAARSVLGTAFPLFAIPMFRSMTVQGATSMLGGIALLLAPVPFAFRRWGPELRRRSKYAVI